MNEWHKLNCEQAQVKNPTCRCMQVDYHCGAYEVACMLGLVTLRGDSNE